MKGARWLAMLAVLALAGIAPVAADSSDATRVTRARSKPRPQIVVLVPPGCLDDEHLEMLRSFGPVKVSGETLDESQTVARARGAQILIANPNVVTLTRALFESTNTLRLLVLTITGFDRVDMDAAQRHGVRVVNSPDYSTEAVAEYTFALILAAVRHIPQADAAARSGQIRVAPADETLAGFELAGKTLGVVGLGRIGTRVAQIGMGFGMRTVAWDRIDKHMEGVIQMPLEELLSESDVVTLHVASNAQTAGLVNASRLALMKPTAVLVNTVRAELVDGFALYSALRDKRLAAAGLDVLDDSETSRRLATLDSVVLSPHAAYHSRESRARCAESVVGSVRSFITNPLLLPAP